MGMSFYILQCGVIFLAGADFHDLGDVVDEDLAVADVAGVQRLRRGVNDLLHGDLAHDDLDLDLRQQRGVDLGAAILLAAALLQAAAHDLGHGHAGDADLVQRLLQGLKLGKLYNDGNLVHAAVQLGGQRGFFYDLDGGRNLLRAGLRDVVLAQVGVLVGVQFGVGRVADGKTGVGTRQAVLMDIQAVQLLLLGDAQADGLFDDGKDDEHRNQHPGQHADKPSSWMPSFAKPPP